MTAVFGTGNEPGRLCLWKRSTFSLLEAAKRESISLGPYWAGDMWASKWRRPCGVARLEDPDVGSAIQGLLKRVVGRSGNQVWVTVEGPGGVRDIEATDILVAAGRIPNTRSVGLDQAGVDLDARGYIAVDDKLQTSAKNIWALGDCAGSPQFTHAAFDDFRVVRDNLNGGNRTTPGIGSSRSE